MELLHCGNDRLSQDRRSYKIEDIATLDVRRCLIFELAEKLATRQINQNFGLPPRNQLCDTLDVGNRRKVCRHVTGSARLWNGTTDDLKVCACIHKDSRKIISYTAGSAGQQNPGVFKRHEIDLKYGG